MSVDKGSEETYKHLNPKYCKLIQMPEEGSGESLGSQNPSPKKRSKPFSEKLVRVGLAASTLGGVGLGIEASNKAQASNESGHKIQVNSQPNKPVIQFKRVDWVKDLKPVIQRPEPSPLPSETGQTVDDVTSPKEQSEALTAGEMLRNLTPKTDPFKIYVDVRHSNLIKDPSGNILGFEVLGNKDRFTQDPNKFRIFTSLQSSGVFSEFKRRNGEFGGDPTLFYRANSKTFVAFNSGVMIMDETTGRSESIPFSPAYMAYKAVFPESAILALGRYGEVALVNMNTSAYKVLPLKLDHLEQGAVVGASLQRLSDNSILAGVASPRGPYGVAEVKFNFSGLSLNGQPEWHYRDRRSDNYYGYVGASGKVEEVYLYDRDNDKLFIADHTTKQKKDEYKIPGLYSIKVDENEVVAIVGVTGDRARKVWPRGVNPELNPEKVTTVNIQEGFNDGTASSGVYDEIPEGYINGELYDFILTAEKSIIAVKRQPNPDKSFDKYMLINGVPESYEAPPATSTLPATNTPIPSVTPENPTSTPTPSPTVTQKLHQVFMSIIKRAHNLFGW